MNESPSTTVILPSARLEVSRVCLGTGGIGSGTGLEASMELLDAYIECGGNFIDTAHNYGNWDPTLPKSASERVIGKWMAARGNRSTIVLATKGGHPFFETPEIGRLSRSDLEDDISGSLECLQTETIDLYWLHADEPSRPVGEVMETLHSFVESGRARHLGASNWKTSRIKEANDYANSHGLSPFIADQVLWNAADLAGYPYGNPNVGFVNRERYDFHLKTGMAMIPFQAHAFGLFSRMASGTLDSMNAGFRGFYKAEDSQLRFGRIQELMGQTGLSLSQVVLGYLASQPFVTVPIVGSHTAEQVRDSMAALTVRLTREQVDFIDGGQKGSELH
jgi:aryl-alcohol dehydrogenase-like predicted oxidoreductase